MTKIRLYNYNGHPNTINKVLGEGKEFTGHLKQDFEVTRPYLNLRSDSLPAYNYCYIDTLGRYYFITSVTYLGNQTYELSLSEDVLKTYEDAIMNGTATLGESSESDPYVSNRANVYDKRPNFEQVNFPNKGLYDENGSIVLVTIKGGAQ